jgi:exopolysaccharide biosynthesis polyprenyl glycosylphosphotransferase
MYKEYHRYKIFLMIADVVITVLVLFAIVELRPMLPGRPILAWEVLPHPVLYVLIALLWHALFASMGVYENDRIPDFSKQITRFTQAHIFAVFTFAGLLYFSFREVSRMLVIYFSVGNFVFMFLVRYGLWTYLKKMRVFFGGTKVLIVGSSGSALKLADTILREHGSVVRLIGFAHDNGSNVTLSAPHLGSLEDVPEIVRNYSVDLVMIATEGQSEQIEKLIFQLESFPVRIYLVPDMLRLALVQADVESFGDIVTIGIREPVIRGHRRVFKRIMDVTISVLVLLLTWPLLLIVWIAIKVDSPGPAIFVARRVGANGKLFNMYKFRTMVIGAEQLQHKLVSYNNKNERVYKVQNDPRVTRLGRFLRRTSIDELPQIFNVLKGDMSLVGPRPEQPFITEHYDHWQWRRLSVPPGITGWWQVSGRSDLAMHLNSQYDMFYVRNYSIILDLKILVKTIGTVIRGKGAY